MYQNCMDFDEAAEMIGSTESSLRAYYKEWDVPSIRIAGRVWFIEGEVRAWGEKKAVAHRQQAAQADAMFRAMNDRRQAMGRK